MKLASEKVIEEFVDEVEQFLGDRLEKTFLFGSYARGEHVPGSDIDIAFIVTEVKRSDRNRIKELQDEFLKKGYLFSPRLIEQEEFEEKVREGYVFHESIEEEGIEI